MIRSAEEFARLRRSNDSAEYRRSATDSAADEVWIEVIERFPDLRQWVAHNRTISERVMERLAVDPDEQVRWRIASKKAVPSHVLTELATDPSEMVRVQVLRHRRLPLEALETLCTDPVATIRTDALYRLNATEREEPPG